MTSTSTPISAATSASTTSFNFVISLGNGWQVTRAQISIRAIQEGVPVLISQFDVTENCFSQNLPADRYPWFYVVAQIEAISLDGVSQSVSNIQLLAVFNQQSAAALCNIALSEPGTVANIFCFARFLCVDDSNQVLISTSARRAGLAYGMKNNFCTVDGSIAKVIQSSPNGLESNSYALFNFLANLLYYCLTDSSIHNSFLTLAGSEKTLTGSLPALLQLALQPFTAVASIYNLIATRPAIFTPWLPGLSLPGHASPVPNQWSLTIKVNDTGARNFLFGGPANIAFDQDDKVWITNNVTQGTPTSCNFCVVLNPDGSPCSFSPLFGGGLMGAGFGIVANRARDKIYIGNFGWGSSQYNPLNGSVSAFTADGRVQSPSNGWVNQLSRVQGMGVDSQGNLWMCSWGSQEPMVPKSGTSPYQYPNHNSAVVVYLQADPNQALCFEFDSPDYGTFDLVIDSADNAIVSNQGSSHPHIASSVYKLRIENLQIVQVASWISDYDSGKQGVEGLKQVTLNSHDEIFVAAGSSNRIIKLDQNLNFVRDFTQNIHSPWGLTIDSADVLYVANFGDQPGGAPFGIVVIPNQDDDQSKLMTLPTGGQPVLLASGRPLYGDAAPPSFSPLMRLTSTSIDGAGNLWACNNWKPSLAMDIGGNPGGDGIVIFVAAAQPGN